MPYDSQGFFYSCTISALISCVLLSAARVLHKRHFVLKHINVWRCFRSMWPLQPSTAFNFGGWMPEKSRFVDAYVGGHDPFLAEIQGAEAHLYLMFLRLAGCVFAVVGACGAALLIPVYATDSYNREYYWEYVWPRHCCDADGAVKPNVVLFSRGLGDWTVRNVTPGSQRLWASVFVAGLLTYEVCAMVTKILRELRVAKSKATPDTVLLTDVGENTDKVNQQLQKHIPAHMWREVKCIAVPRVPPKGMLAAMDDLEVAKKGLQRMYAIMEKEGITEAEAPTHEKLIVKDGAGGCCGNKVNGVEFYRNRADELSDKLLRLKAEMEGDVKYAGVAFVTMKSPDACAKVVARANPKREGLLGHLDTVVQQAVSLTGADRKVWFAPIVPDNILWANLGTPTIVRVVGHALTMAALVWISLFWGAVVGFLGNIENLGVNVDHWDPTLRGLLTAYLPVIVTAILLALLPILMRVFVEHVVRVPDKVEREVRECRYLIAFTLATVLFLQAILQGGGDSIAVLNSLTWETALNLFVQMVSPVNGYFVVLVMSAAFIGAPVRLNLFPEWILGNLQAKLAFTRTEADEAFYRKPFTFSEEYPKAVLIFGFAVLLSVNLPYMGFFAACYFYMKYLTDRAILIDAYPRCRESPLRLVPVVVYTVLALLLVMQFFGVVLLCLAKENIPCAVVGAVIMAATVVFSWCTYHNIEYVMGPAFLQGESHPMRVLPSVLAKLFGYDAWIVQDDTAFKVDTHAGSADSARGGSAGKGGADNDDADAGLKGVVPAAAPPTEDVVSEKYAEDIFDFTAQTELSPYENPCSLLVPERIDHAAMQAKSWLYVASDVPTPNVHLVLPDVFMQNLTEEELAAVEARREGRPVPLMKALDEETPAEGPPPTEASTAAAATATATVDPQDVALAMSDEEGEEGSEGGQDRVGTPPPARTSPLPPRPDITSPLAEAKEGGYATFEGA